MENVICKLLQFMQFTVNSSIDIIYHRFNSLNLHLNAYFNILIILQWNYRFRIDLLYGANLRFYFDFSFQTDVLKQKQANLTEQEFVIICWSRWNLFVTLKYILGDYSMLTERFSHLLDFFLFVHVSLKVEPLTYNASLKSWSKKREKRKPFYRYCLYKFR